MGDEGARPERGPRHAFTVDLEEWFHGIELAEDQWPSQTRLRVGLDRLLSLLDAHGTKATFFVLGAVAEAHPHVVAEIAGEGHEIACHGHAHQLIYRQSADQFRRDVRRGRAAVEDAAGLAPAGYRAPYFSVRRDSMWALDILAEEGFRYDSSIFPVRNYRYGVPDAPRTPHDVPTRAGDLREVPITPLRIAGRNIPFSGGAYLRILPWWAQRLAWAAAERKGEPVMTYIHPWELDPAHPRISLPRRIAATHYARLQLTERRLDRLLSRFRFGRLDAVFPTG